MFYDNQPLPWWGPGLIGGLNGVQIPEEVPLTVDAAGKALRKTSISPRQSLFSPSNPFYGPTVNTDYTTGPVSSLDAARDSNSSNTNAALRRATRRLSSNYFNYRRMRADGIVAIGREFADALICTAQWTYEKCADDADVDEEWLKTIREMWEGRGLVGESHEGYTLREFFLSESCRAKDHGNHTLEIVYGDGDDGLTTVDEFLPLLPENTRPLVFAGTRKFAGVRNWGVTGQEVDLEPPYCVRFIYDGEGGDLFGRSRFENCKDWIQLKWDIREKIRTDLNISIGNIMKVGYPVDDNNDQTKTTQNEAKASNIAVSLAKGLSITYPTFSIKMQAAMAKDGVDPTKLDAWKIGRLETGPNSFDGFRAATDLVDEQILFGLLTLPRAVREADHGSKADSEQHTDSMVSMVWRWITYVTGIAQNITDTILVQRFGQGAKGQVRVKPVPLADEAKAILTQIFTQLLSDKSLALKVLDIKSGLEKLQVKTLPDFDQDDLAAQMDAAAEAQGIGDVLSSREKMKRAGYKDEDVDRIQKEKATEDAIPTDEDGLGGGTKALSDDQPGGAGHWITIGGGGGDEEEGGGGTHVFIRDGRIAKGPAGLKGRKLDDLSAKHRDSMRDARRTRETSELSADEKKEHKQTARKYSESSVHRELMDWHKEHFGGGVDDYLGEAAHGNTGISRESAQEHVRGGGSVNVHKHVKGGHGEDFRAELIQNHGPVRGERLYQDYVNTRLAGEGGRVDEAISAAQETDNQHQHPRMAFLAHHVTHIQRQADAPVEGRKRRGTIEVTAQEEVNAEHFGHGDSFTAHGEEFKVSDEHGVKVLRGAGMELPYADTMGRLPIDKGSYRVGKTSGQQKGLLGQAFDGPIAGSKTGSMFGDVSKGPANALEAKGNEVGQAVKDKETAEMFPAGRKKRKGK